MFGQNRLLRIGILLCCFLLILIVLQWINWIMQRKKRPTGVNLFCCRNALKGICLATILDIIGFGALVTLFLFLQKGWFQLNSTITYGILGTAVIFLFLGSLYWHFYFSFIIRYDARTISITYSIVSTKRILWSEIQTITHVNSLRHPASLLIEVRDGSYLYIRKNWIGYENFELMAKTKNLIS